MQLDELLLRRLNAQHLLSPGADPAADLCGLQAQHLKNACHALRLRTDDPTVEGLVKTWTLRGTMHLVPERDLPLYLRHSGPAEAVCESAWYQWQAGRGQANPPQREQALARLAVEAIASGIDEREALRLHLRQQGMTDAEEANAFHPWGGLVAELANIGVLAFRVDMADEQHPAQIKRYRLLPPFTPMEESAARLALARRYFTHYGPATLRDAAYFFRWTQAELKALLAQLPAESTVCNGQTHFFLPTAEPPRDMPEVLLLAGFDPLMLGYRKEENPFLPGAHLRGIFNLAGIVHPAILLRGRVVGKWREQATRVELTAFDALAPADRALIAREAERLLRPKKLIWT